MLDLESFTYLNRALESPISPIVILASNRGLSPIHLSTSTHEVTSLPPSPHGIPPDLLARLLIIPTHPYTGPEIDSIVRLRAKTENININEDGLAKLGELGKSVSLRYACSLLGPAKILAGIGGREGGVVGRDQIAEAADLFWDAGRSVQSVGDAWIQ